LQDVVVSTTKTL